MEIPLSRFLLTWKGKLVEEVVELNAKRITSLGISLAGGDQLQAQVGRLGVVSAPRGQCAGMRWGCRSGRSGGWLISRVC